MAKKPKGRMTNVEAVTDIMETSKFGALAQLFVIDALEKWSARVANAKPEELASMNDSFGPSAAAWQGVAREIQGKLAQHLKG